MKNTYLKRLALILKGEKRHKDASNERGGYFVLFFAMLITMLMLPILTSVLTQTIETRQNIATFQKSSNLVTLGNSALKAKLDELSKEGLGRKQTGEMDLGDGITLHYDYSSISKLPVMDTGFSVTELAPIDAKLIDDSEDGLSIDSLGTALGYLEAEIYTVPALGTGDAGGEECVPGVINEATYKDGEPVDPLDHPCNWSTLSVGESVTLPFYRQDDDWTNTVPPDYVVAAPENLLLRVRLKCADNSYLCKNEDRLVLWDEGFIKKDGYLSPALNDPKADFSKRILDLALMANGKVYVPNTESIRVIGDELPSGKHKHSQEITVQKMRNDSNDTNRDTVEYIERRFELYSNNLTVLNLSLVRLQNLLGLDNMEQSVQMVLDNDEINLPKLILGFTKNRILACDPISNNCKFTEENPFTLPSERPNWAEDTSPIREVYELEYQVLSDVPLANHKFVIKGSISNGDDEYQLDVIEKKGPKTSAPAAVFSS